MEEYRGYIKKAKAAAMVSPRIQEIRKWMNKAMIMPKRRHIQHGRGALLFVERRNDDGRERIRLEGDDLALYDKYGYVTNFLLWKDDLESDDWEVLEDDCN